MSGEGRQWLEDDPLRQPDGPAADEATTPRWLEGGEFGDSRRDGSPLDIVVDKRDHPPGADGTYPDDRECYDYVISGRVFVPEGSEEWHQLDALFRAAEELSRRIYDKYKPPTPEQ